MSTLADVVAIRVDNLLETGMPAADMIPTSSTPEELVSRNSESTSRDGARAFAVYI